jgi:hypothetical protein
MKSLAQTRDQVLKIEIARQIEAFVKGYKKRRCAWCAGTFVPISRYHFFDSPDCRHKFYGGVFRPRRND